MCIAAVVQVCINEIGNVHLPEWTVIPLTALLKAGASWIATKKLNQIIGSVMVLCLLMCGFCTSPAQCQVLQTQTMTVLPQVRSIGVTPPLEVVSTQTFSATAFWDKNSYAVAPVGREIWRYGKLHNTVFAYIRPEDKVQVGAIDAIGYDIYFSKPFRKLFKNPSLTVVFTPCWGIAQDLTANANGDVDTKPYPGLSVTVRW
jgi:hypothetical protein